MNVFSLRRLTLTRQLSIGFGFLLLCMVVTLGTDIATSANQEAITNRLIHHLYPARQQAKTIVQLMLAVDDDGAWYLMTRDPHQQVQLMYSYQQDVRHIRESLAEATALADTPQQRDALAQLSYYFFGQGGYYDDSQTSFAIKRADQGVLAGINYTDTPFLPTIQHDTQIYLDVVDREIAQAEADERSAAWIVQSQSIGLGGGGVLFGIGITLLVTRSIKRLYQQIAQKNAELTAINTRLQALATTDPLTELPNHRALLSSLENEAARARRYGHPLSILFFDGDHFKKVNDTYGHAVGDAVLRELGNRVRNQLRAGDLLGRYGGEEFVVLLPETDLAQACQMAERVRKAVAEHPLAAALVKEGVPMTVSLGVASFPAESTTASEVVEKADQAMYWAKRLGRNQVRTARDAERLSRDEALAATISHLERSHDPRTDGMSLEQVTRANQLNTIQSLLWLLDLRDQDTSTHSHEVSDLAAAIARELGASQEEVFATTTAALLHDLGKIALPDGLLSKAGPLTHAERALIEQHPALGAQILEVSPFLHHLMPAVRHHHEHWDGTGYPDGLCAEAIPQAARIIAVAEAYQAMTSERPYQRRRSTTKACEELLRCAGTHFDPLVVQATLQVLSRQAQEVEEGNPFPSPKSLAH